MARKLYWTRNDDELFGTGHLPIQPDGTLHLGPFSPSSGNSDTLIRTRIWCQASMAAKALRGNGKAGWQSRTAVLLLGALRQDNDTSWPDFASQVDASVTVSTGLTGLALPADTNAPGGYGWWQTEPIEDSHGQRKLQDQTHLPVYKVALSISGPDLIGNNALETQVDYCIQIRIDNLWSTVETT